MARIRVVLFRESDGSVPLVEWLDALPEKARGKCFVRLERLEAMGHELRRPEADYLDEGIYELRASRLGMNYRMLYFFHGRAAVVVSHGITKQQAMVPTAEIRLAVERKLEFERNPSLHSFEGEA